MAEAGDQPVCADVLISHTHWDHIQGFPFFAPAYSDRNRIRVWQSEQIDSDLVTALRGQMQSLHFPVSLDQMRGVTSFEKLNGEPTVVGPYSIRSSALNHPGGCAGFRIETAYGSLAYLPDHEPLAREASNGQRNALIDFVRQVDLLILDTQYTEEEYRRHVGWGHGCLPDSVTLAKEAAVRRLAFFHHDPSHRDYQIDLMVEAGRKLVRSTNLEICAATEMETIFLTSGPSSLPSGQPILAWAALESTAQESLTSVSRSRCYTDRTHLVPGNLFDVRRLRWRRCCSPSAIMNNFSFGIA